MAEDTGQERNEEATPERREEFREKGQVAVSREITSTFEFVIAIGFIAMYTPYLMRSIERLFLSKFQLISHFRITEQNFFFIWGVILSEFLWIVVPLFLVTSAVAIGATFAQTRFNYSWKKIAPDFKKLNPLQGLKRMLGSQAAMELGKGIGKVVAIGSASWLILSSEWIKIPGLLRADFTSAWQYWWQISLKLFFWVSGIMLLIACADYAYQWFQLEKQLKMTKQEVKEEYKKREVDPIVRQRMRRMQRDFSSKRMLDRVRDATVIITNPTHYSVALRYEFGMDAPQVIAKGKDFLALRIREEAKKFDVPLVENKPLARGLFASVDVDHLVPPEFYKAVSEVIRYVFKMKNVKIPLKTASA
jgi:flagellar biosynthesis protein FlhB